MNLNNYAGKGIVFFDCPPIYFGSLTIDNMKPLDLKREVLVDPQGSPVPDQRMPSPKQDLITFTPEEDAED